MHFRLSIISIVFCSNVVLAQRRVYPLIPINGPSPFKPSGLNTEGNSLGDWNQYNLSPVQQPQIPVWGLSSNIKGRFVAADGAKTPCSTNADCYPYREPKKWCYLISGSSWAGKGCYCDRAEGACIIQRQGPQELQWTWCAPKDSWTCETPERQY